MVRASEVRAYGGKKRESLHTCNLLQIRCSTVDGGAAGSLISNPPYYGSTFGTAHPTAQVVYGCAPRCLRSRLFQEARRLCLPLFESAVL